MKERNQADLHEGREVFFFVVWFFFLGAKVDVFEDRVPRNKTGNNYLKGQENML